MSATPPNPPPPDSSSFPPLTPSRSYLTTTGFGLGIPAALYEVTTLLGHLDAPDFDIASGWKLLVPHVLALVVIGAWMYATAKLKDVKTGIPFFDKP